jgi:PAS domain S-box-containing protein
MPETLQNNFMNTFDNYFESFFYNSKQNAALIIGFDEVVTAINPAFTKIFGYSEEDLVGKKVAVLFTKADGQKELFKKEAAEVLVNRQSFDNNYLVKKDQSITWVRGESVLIESNDNSFILKIIQDIHEQKITENALRSLNGFNENILRSIEDVVIVLDEKMNIIKANKAFAKLFRYGVPQISSLNFAELIKSYDKNGDLIMTIKNSFHTRNGFSNKQMEMEISITDTRTYDVSCSFMHSALDKNVLLIVHDITAYKQLEKEKEDVMGFVAHELRNPLSNVMLCNELMSEALKENDVELIESMLEKSKNNASRLQKMISELYESTKINSGYMQLHISEFNFFEAIKEAIETVEVLQPAYQITVKGNANIIVRGDRYRIIQVLTNYLSNGIKYSNGKTRVSLKITHDEKTLTVSVKDEGLGISKEQLPYVFERFFRVEKTRNIEGIGLGLYLCRQIVHAHKGRVWAESEEGKGSVFYFSIPLMQ